ncbi:MAG: DUF167 domain-containing protein [Chloroflexota bacterium]
MSIISAMVKVHVTPNAAQNQVTGNRDGVWQLKIAAPPVQGKANAELIDFLAEKLGVRRSDVAIVRGHTSRNKVLCIGTITADDAAARLNGGS